MGFLPNGDDVTKRGLLLAAAVVAGGLVAIPAIAGIVYTYDGLGRLKNVQYDNGYQITYTYDPAGNRTQVVSQLNGNHLPVANPDSLSILEGAISLTFDPRTNDTDPDGDPITILSVNGAAHGNAVVANGGTGITYTPVGRSNSDSMSYQIGVPWGGIATGTITLTTINQPPVAVNDAISVTPNQPLTFNPLANDSDPGHDPLVVTSVTNGSLGSAAVVSGGQQITYTPRQSAVGSDNLTYTIADTYDGGTASASVAVTIAGVNHPPVASGGLLTASEVCKTTALKASGSLDLSNNFSDPDGDAVSISSVTQGAKGFVTGAGSVVTYTYNTAACYEFSDSDSFTYTVSDGRGGSATATISVSVHGRTIQ